MYDVVILFQKKRDCYQQIRKLCFFFQLEMFFIHSSWKFKTDFKYEQQLIDLFSSFWRSPDFFF